MTGPTVVGEPAGDRLMNSIRARHRPLYDGPLPTEEQVAWVLHALADHTMLLTAVDYRADELGLTRHGVATSLGQFCHDTADQLERVNP